MREVLRRLTKPAIVSPGPPKVFARIPIELIADICPIIKREPDEIGIKPTLKTVPARHHGAIGMASCAAGRRLAPTASISTPDTKRLATRYSRPGAKEWVRLAR